MNIITNSFDLTFRQLLFQFNFLISYFKVISYFKIISHRRAILFRRTMLIKLNNLDIKIAFTFNSNKQNKTYRRRNRFCLFLRKKSNSLLILRIKIKKINQKTRSISFVDFLIKRIRIKLIDTFNQHIMLIKMKVKMITSKIIR